MLILGIGGTLNDAACAVMQDGKLAAAVEQKKIARRVRAGELPEESIAYCLASVGAQGKDVDCVAVVRPLSLGPESAFHLKLRERFPNCRIRLVEHHVAHAASAYFGSPFDEAQVLTLDREGDFRCGASWRAEGNQLHLERELYYPDSLGDVYGRVTELLGFEQRADEHKVQWLSATTEDCRFADVFLQMLNPQEGGWPRVDRTYIDSERKGAGGFSERFHAQLGIGGDGSVPEKLRAVIAASLQHAVESTVAGMVPPGRNLCLAGGLGFNALLVRALESAGRWENVFVQPAAGNAGTALGAVYHAWHSVYGHVERVPLGNLCLGPSYGPEEIKQVLENCKLRFRYLLTTGELIDTAVAELLDHRIVAWMQGRMEFGPRALGNRSILASPLNPYSTENLNRFIKHREQFRKFAASVPAELAAEYFEVGANGRFLATVGKVREAHRNTFESAVLGRELARVHLVEKEDNPLYWSLLHAAGKACGLPVVYNTSFNLFGDPLVCTPRDAVRSFYSSGIDAMLVGNFLLEK